MPGGGRSGHQGCASVGVEGLGHHSWEVGWACLVEELEEVLIGVGGGRLLAGWPLRRLGLGLGDGGGKRIGWGGGVRD